MTTAHISQEGEQEESRVHVLAPYTKNVNSIKRHVRTRIYFTSESHIHSLMNILRYEDHDGRSLLSEAAREQLDSTREFDYLTQIVFRLYEMKNVRPTTTTSFPRYCPAFRSVQGCSQADVGKTRAGVYSS